MGGEYALVRVHRHGENYAALFRMTTGVGLYYHDLKLVKGADGKIKVHDLYVLLAGELVSKTIRQVSLPVIVNDNGTPLEKLPPEERDFVTHFSKYQELIKTMRAGDFAKVKELCAAMPKSMQETKLVLIARHNAAAQTQQWDEARVMGAEFRRIYPDDEGLELLGLGSLMFEKKIDAALALVDRIDKFVGGDPYLDTVRAKIRAIK
jgi:hypothetical protein